MARMHRIGRMMPAGFLLVLMTIAFVGPAAWTENASAAADEGQAGAGWAANDEPVEAQSEPARPHMVSMPEPDAARRSRAMLAARAYAGDARSSTLDAVTQPEQRQQDLGVEIYSDAVPGCTRLEAELPPSLDCTLTVGGSFTQRLRALAIGGAGADSDLVRISPIGLATGMRLERLDDSGQVVPGPMASAGHINARLGFVPSASQVTAPGAPIELAMLAERVGSAGETLAVAEIRLRFHVMPASQGQVVGYVFDDRDGNGQREIGEPGLAAWPLSLSGGGQATTDANGRFEIGGLSTGAYELSLGDRAGWLPTRPARVSLKVEAGQVVEVLFGLRQGGGDTRVSATLQTDRGCNLNGASAIYQLGETLQVFLEARGLPEVDISLERLSDQGVERLLDRRRVPGSQAFSFQIDAGDRRGDVELRLSVFAPDEGAPSATASCGYSVQSADGPSIGYAPLSLDFGAVSPNGATRASVTLRNDGQEMLIVNTLAIQGGSGSAFQLGSVGLDGLRLAPGQSQVVDLGFAPRGTGSFQDFLLLRCNAHNQPLVSIPLYGQTTTGGPVSNGYVRTDRGCLETQENPLYFVGDPIQLRMRVDAQGQAEAAARIEDLTPDGRTRVIFSRNVPVNQELTLAGAQVAPPVGYEALRLTAQVGYEQVRNECSFRVAAGGTRIVGYKFNDQNGNGIWEGCPTTPWIPGSEPAIPGWGITLTGPESYTTYTDANGRYEFVVSAPGSYYVTEEQRSGWQPTRPASVALNVQCYPGEQLPEVYFGNRETGGCQPGKDPCWPSPTQAPGWPTPTPAVWPTPTPASATATAALPSPTAGGPTVAPPPQTPPPPPPVCFAQISPRPSLMNVGERAQFSVGVTGGGQVLGYQWSVSGDVIRDYSELTRQSWSTSAMTSGDYQGQSLAFYWKPEANQRHPQNAGPQPRTVSVTVTTAAGECTAQHVLNVERNNNSLSRQAEDFYTANHTGTILTEHTLWHATYPFAGWSYDGALFFDFHRQYLNRFNNWRAEFGYPPLGIWDSGTSLPRGIDVDHAARGGFYVQQPKPSWFTLNGFTGRPGNGLPCDSSRGGERNLRDYPANRSLLGCSATHPWHNTVHTAIGGDMLNPQFSPRDPVFWRWHNFVDIVSQERMGVFAAALLERLDPNDQNMPALPDAPQSQESPPHVVYQEPFRLYRFLDGLEDFAVEFDQPVSGVTADDLTVNGKPATELERVSSQRYIFRGFPAPELGRLEVHLAPGDIKNLYNVIYEGDRWRYHVIDPTIDEDRDGLLGREELDVYLTSPIDRDSDDDGLSDGDEVRLYGTRPLMWDSDLDGANDRCEIEKGSDPNDPANTARGCPVSSVFICWAGNGVPDR